MCQSSDTTSTYIFSLKIYLGYSTLGLPWAYHVNWRRLWEERVLDRGFGGFIIFIDKIFIDKSDQIVSIGSVLYIADPVYVISQATRSNSQPTTSSGDRGVPYTTSTSNPLKLRVAQSTSQLVIPSAHSDRVACTARGDPIWQQQNKDAKRRNLIGGCREDRSIKNSKLP